MSDAEPPIPVVTVNDVEHHYRDGHWVRWNRLAERWTPSNHNMPAALTALSHALAREALSASEALEWRAACAQAEREREALRAQIAPLVERANAIPNAADFSTGYASVWNQKREQLITDLARLDIDAEGA